MYRIFSGIVLMLTAFMLFVSGLATLFFGFFNAGEHLLALTQRFIQWAYWNEEDDGEE